MAHPCGLTEAWVWGAYLTYERTIVALTKPIRNIARVFTPEDMAIQTPNSDTPYSFLGMDLRAEPLVLTVPPIEQDRYFSVQLVDACGNWGRANEIVMRHLTHQTALSHQPLFTAHYLATS